MATPIRLLLADDHTLFRQLLRGALSDQPRFEIVGEARDSAEAISQARALQPDIVLMDLHMPVLDGVQATQLIKQQWPAVTVIALTMYAVEQGAALAAGADAFLIKGSAPAQLLAALGVDVANAQR